MSAKAAVDNSWSQFHSGNSFAGAATKGPDLRIYDTPRLQVGSDLGAAGFGANSSSPVVMNNKVFAYSQSGAVSAFSELNGDFLWSAAISPASFGSWASPSADAASNSVYMGSDANVYRIDAESGQILWTSQLTEYGGTGETYGVVVNAAPTIVPGIGLNGEGLVYQQTYGSFGGGTRLHAFNVADGSIAWTYDTPGQGQGEVAFNPNNGLIYAASNGTGSWADGRGGIVALDAATGNVAWESVDSYFAFSFGGIAYDNANNRVVAGGYSFYSYAGLLVVDGDTGATISYTGDEVAPSGDYRPAIGDDNLIYVTGAEFQDGPFIYAIDATTGDIVWRAGESYSDSWGGWTHSLIYAGDIGDGTDVVYAADQNYYPGSRYGMFDADTGDLLQTLPIGGGPGALANGNLYFLTNEGQLVAFGPEVPEPTSMMLVGAAAMLLGLRRRPKVLATLAILVLSIGFSSSANATLLVNENFDYPDGNLVQTERPWVIYATPNNSPIEVKDGIVTDIRSGTGAHQDVYLPISSTGISTGTVYYSFDFQATIAPETVWEGGGRKHEFFFALADTGASAGRKGILYVSSPEVSTPGKYRLAIANRSVSSQITPGYSENLDIGEWYKVVVAADLDNNTSKLWVGENFNFHPNLPTATHFSEPTTPPLLKMFMIFQQAGIPLEENSLNIDNLRIGTTFAAVVPEPSCLVLASSLASMLLLKRF
jgi:outer membrane protein assembly factor BamB